jgi:tetratricopeptide (TPR) repeat protein
MNDEQQNIDFNNNSIDYVNKGNSLFDLKKYDEAIEYYDKAIKLDIYNFKAFFQKGYTLYKLNKYDDAIEFLDKSINIKCNSNANLIEAYEYKLNS